LVIQKLFGLLDRCVALLDSVGGLAVDVPGSSTGVAFGAGWDEVVEAVVSASVELDEVVGLGCFGFAAPVAVGVTGQDGSPVALVFGVFVSGHLWISSLS
jgi:hypothetical protein